MQGVDVADGFPSEIQRIVARFEQGWPETVDVGEGWFPLLARLDERLSVIAPGYSVQQIKSKFGALSFFARASNDVYDYNEEFNEAIRAAEWESTETCEVCARKAQVYVIRMRVWTLCEEHARREAEPR